MDQSMDYSFRNQLEFEALLWNDRRTLERAVERRARASSVVDATVTLLHFIVVVGVVRRATAAVRCACADVVV